MSIYFTSDTHLGHKVITKYRTQFSTQEEHDEAILTEMSKLKKRDILYVLGDFAFDSDKLEWYLQQIAKMPFRLKLVMGNHDSLELYKQDIARNIEIQLPFFSYKNYWLSHCPIHPQEIRGRLGNLSGHCHFTSVPDDRYYNVGLDTNGFKFVDFDDIKEIMQKRRDSL